MKECSYRDCSQIATKECPWCERVFCDKHIFCPDCARKLEEINDDDTS